MSKKYSFEFNGTKEMFLKSLKKFSGSDSKYYYLDDYIIDVTEEDIRFGVARGGHSGGYWFIPLITEIDQKTIFCGKIRYIDSWTDAKGFKKIINKIEEILEFVILLPIIIIINACFFVSRIVRKILKRPKANEETEEDRLYNLMENHLNCTRI